MEKAVIFLVDDNPANLRAGKSALTENYAVYTAAGAARMFDLLAEKNRRSFSLTSTCPE